MPMMLADNCHPTIKGTKSVHLSKLCILTRKLVAIEVDEMFEITAILSTLSLMKET